MIEALRPQVVIVGAGYTGARLANALKDDQPLALVRSARSLAVLAARGIVARQLDIDAADSMPAGIDRNATVVYLVPPSRDTAGDSRLARFLRLLDQAGRLVYVSTTGVYGDCGGDIVDETRALGPATDRARRRVDAEDRVRRWCETRKVPWIILRVPGIYGPDRLQLSSLDNAQPVIAPGEAAPGNRIHVDDLVRAIVAATAPGNANGVFNIGDGDHATQYEFLETVARLTGRQPPPTVTMPTARRTFSPMRLSFIGESRRIDNRRMLDELGVTLSYPNHESGIRASLDENASVASEDVD